MRVSYVLLLSLFFTQLAMSQKRIRKTIINPQNQSIQIDTKNCFKVVLETSKSPELKVAAAIEGEYQKELIVKIEEDGSNVVVSTGFLPNFILPNDKVSAHKVLSIALKITIPEYCYVTVYGSSSKVQAQGNYKQLKVSLNTGDCILENITENVEVKTQKGRIHLTTNAGEIAANSVYGVVQTSKIPTGNSSYKLASVEGDIYINKTK